MSRLQKKCVIGTAGVHLLLLLGILIASTGFFEPKPKTDNSQILDVIPANLIDAAAQSGVQNAVAPPPPAPPKPPVPVRQTPPPPQPVVKTPEPAPSMMSKIEKFFKPAPTKPAPQSKPDETHQVKPNLKPITRDKIKPTPNPQLARAINSLRKNLSGKTEVKLSGTSTVAYANYGTAVISVYHQKWITMEPTRMEKDNAVVTFKVVISKDGKVISSQIITPSGDANIDNAVQRMLDNVDFIAPFPEGATEQQREYTIDFNATRTEQ